MRKDVKCPSRLLSYAARDTFLPINTFVLPSSSLFPFLKNCSSCSSVFERRPLARWLLAYFRFKLSAFVKVRSLFLVFSSFLWFCGSVLMLDCDLLVVVFAQNHRAFLLFTFGGLPPPNDSFSPPNFGSSCNTRK